MEGWKADTISAISSLLGRDPGRQNDWRKGVIIGGEIGHFTCARYSQLASQSASTSVT